MKLQTHTVIDFIGISGLVDRDSLQS